MTFTFLSSSEYIFRFWGNNNSQKENEKAD